MQAAQHAGEPIYGGQQRQVGIVVSGLVSGSLGMWREKHHLANARSKVGATTTAQLVWILAPRQPEPEGMVDQPTPGN
mgnify:CR=1 FL=1